MQQLISWEDHPDYEQQTFKLFSNRVERGNTTIVSVIKKTSGFKWNLNIYVRSAPIILRVCMIRKRVAYAYQKNLFIAGNIQKTIVWAFSYMETSGLRGSQTRMHEHFR